MGSTGCLAALAVCSTGGSTDVGRTSPTGSGGVAVGADIASPLSSAPLRRAEPHRRAADDHCALAFARTVTREAQRAQHLDVVGAHRHVDPECGAGGPEHQCPSFGLLMRTRRSSRTSRHAVDQAESSAVGLEPRVRRRRAEVELGAVAVKARTRRGDPLGVGVAFHRTACSASERKPS
jgi:hypothetical protein